MASSSNSASSVSYVTCYCGDPAAVKVSRTSRNSGRRFFGCVKGTQGCNFFGWVNNNRSKSVDEEMVEAYHHMRSLSLQKEDQRVVAERLKVMNNGLLRNLENEKKKRVFIQKKYDDCKKQLKSCKKMVKILVLALFVSLFVILSTNYNVGSV